jgi:hypothetical protein
MPHLLLLPRLRRPRVTSPLTPRSIAAPTSTHSECLRLTRRALLQLALRAMPIMWRRIFKARYRMSRSKKASCQANGEPGTHRSAERGAPFPPIVPGGKYQHDDDASLLPGLGSPLRLFIPHGKFFFALPCAHPHSVGARSISLQKNK